MATFPVLADALKRAGLPVRSYRHLGGPRNPRPPTLAFVVRPSPLFQSVLLDADHGRATTSLSDHPVRAPALAGHARQDHRGPDQWRRTIASTVPGSVVADSGRHSGGHILRFVPAQRYLVDLGQPSFSTSNQAGSGTTCHDPPRPVGPCILRPHPTPRRSTNCRSASGPPTGAHAGAWLGDAAVAQKTGSAAPSLVGQVAQQHSPTPRPSQRNRWQVPQDDAPHQGGEPTRPRAGTPPMPRRLRQSRPRTP